MNHRISLFIRKRGQTRRDILQHFHKNTSQTTKDHMPELLLIFRSNEKFRTFQHWLYHDCFRIGYLHHTVKLQRQMLLTLDIQHDPANIRFMHRSNDFCHHRKSATTGKSHHFFLIIRHKFIYKRNTGCMKQSLYMMRRDISVIRNRINDPPNSRNIHSEQFYFRNCRFRSIHNAGKSSP